MQNRETKIVYAQAVWLDERVANRASQHVLPDETRKVARAAWGAYEGGQVELAQRRDGTQFDIFARSDTH